MPTLAEALTDGMRNGHIYRTLYHFTDRRNLDLVREHGLLSKAELARRGLNSLAPGGNEWSIDADAAKGLTNYVNLGDDILDKPVG